MESLHAFSEIKKTFSYLDNRYVAEVEKAFIFAKSAHLSQFRISGDPYISHPLGVAQILGMLKLDHHTIMAGLLHDVVEDTLVTHEEIQTYFGNDVAAIVDGVTKISSLKYKNVVAFQAENYRKMFMAIAEDVRVVFVKLADRLHNMRTCQVMSLKSRQRIAKETLEVYAPIAKRLGMHGLSQELFELGFAARYPLRYATLLEHMYQINSGQADVLAHLSYQIKTQAKAQGIENIEVSFREKQLYGIYQKMILKRASFSKLMDVYALRVCVDKVSDCYHLLGIVHSLYRPKERQMKDYIASPKANGYQSIHTVLYGPYDMPIEIQIRTREMHLVAVQGVAAHWIYKSGTSDKNQQKQQAWFKRIVESQSRCQEDAEYLQLVKHQIHQEEVYVLTPKGMVLELKQGATVLDMAYHVHTDVGHHCVSAEVDRVKAPLYQVLRNGQTVQIFTDPSSQPVPSWLDIVVTPKAKAAIRQFLKERVHFSDRKIGMQILRAAMVMRGVEKKFSDAELDQVVLDLGYLRPNVYYKNLVSGQESCEVFVNQYCEGMQSMMLGRQAVCIVSDDTIGAMKLSNCCMPVAGDKAFAVLTQFGHEVHRANCRQGNKLAGMKAMVEWSDTLTHWFDIAIRVTIYQGENNLAYILSVIGDMQAKLVAVFVAEGEGEGVYQIGLKVRSLAHFSLVEQSIKQIKSVFNVEREEKCEFLLLAQG